jgi:protein TonB
LIYDKVEASRPSRLGPTGVSLAVHVLVILSIVVGGTYKGVKEVEKSVEVKFLGKGSAGAPPPPPPPAGPKKTRRKPVTKIEQPKVVPLQVPPQDIPEPKEVPKEEAPAAEGGQEGGVVGGVAGGVVGGVVGGTGGGGNAPPPPPEPPPKVKNVPAFAMKGRVIDQPLPRIRNEAFKQSHRGSTINGLYKVCVGLDGKVYEVTPVKPIEGVDEEVMESIKEGWLYKPQDTRVCFVYGFDYTFQ